jgi:prepilin-type N-terminal cleavage/methylation domain-containing protein
MKGFTLIEILITLSLVTLLTSVGVVVSLNNIQRNLVNEAGADLKSMLLQARDYSLAGRKISCTTALRGWQVDINTSAKQAVLSEVCDSTIPFITKNFSSSLTIVLSGSSSILFAIITGGTNLNNTSTITISNSLTNSVVTVTPGGVVQ